MGSVSAGLPTLRELRLQQARCAVSVFLTETETTQMPHHYHRISHLWLFNETFTAVLQPGVKKRLDPTN